MLEIQALGLIEVKGYLGAVASADAALKTSDVVLINAEVIRGGLTTLQFSGDVAAVKVAVDAGSAIAENLNCLISSHVIPRAAKDTAEMLQQPKASKECIEAPQPKVEKEEQTKELPVEDKVVESKGEKKPVKFEHKQPKQQVSKKKSSIEKSSKAPNKDKSAKK
ncbi:MAG: BMC domain-containing protein [Vagococcus sp.]